MPTEEHAGSREQAIHYFKLALQYAVAGGEPLEDIIMGRVGTGKRTQARAPRDALGWEVISSDRVRKSMLGVPLHQGADEPTPARLCADDLLENTHEALLVHTLECSAKGTGAVLDATFGRCTARAAPHGSRCGSRSGTTAWHMASSS